MNADRLAAPEAPAVSELALVFRPFRGEADYPVMAQVVNASEAADLIEETTTAEQIANEYAHMPEGRDSNQDVLLAEVEGQMVGYAYVWVSVTESGERLYRHRGYLLPEWRRKGIGQAMFRWAEARLCAIAAERQEDSALLQMMAEDTAYGRVALAERNGYHPVRYFYFMQRAPLDNLPDAPLPASVELRPARPEHLRAIWEAKEEAFADHGSAYAEPGHLASTEADYQRWVNDPYHDLRLWQIAWAVDADAIAGLSLNSIIEDDNTRYGFRRGWINSLGVRRAWRGRGLARALLVSGMRVLRERGMTEAVLGVDADSLTGATRLYESVGYRVLNKDALYRKRIKVGRVSGSPLD